jgi:methionine-rich copper-binding protein CopC
MDTRLIGRLGVLPALAFAVALVAPAPAAAHAPLASTTPADGEELTSPPEEVVMVFDGELDPDGSGFVVTDADGTEVGTGDVDLDIAQRNEIRGLVDITDPGDYTVAWTSAAADGHPEEGTFTFSVVDPDAAGGSQGTPNTAALAPPGPHPLVLAGMVLLGLAAMAGIRTLSIARA